MKRSQEKAKAAVEQSKRVIRRGPIEIKMAIEEAGRRANTLIEQVNTEARAEEAKAVRELTAGVAEHADRRDRQLATAFTVREASRKRALEIREEAKRKAEGDYRRALAEIDEGYEAARTALAAELREHTAPAEVTLSRRRAEIAARRDDRCHEIINAMDNEIAPLQAELDAIEEARTDEKKRTKTEVLCAEDEAQPVTVDNTQEAARDA